MRRFFVLAVIFLTGILIIGLTSAWSEDVNTVFNQLKAELQKQRVAAKDITNIEKPVKEMLGRGAAKDDLKKTLLDLSTNDVKGDDLKSTVDLMNDLVKTGEAPKQAGNIVSQAAAAAKAQKLKGKELAAKVQEAIQKRKTEMEQARKKAKEQEIKMQQMKAKEQEMKMQQMKAKEQETKMKEQQMKAKEQEMKEQQMKAKEQEMKMQQMKTKGQPETKKKRWWRKR